MDTFSTVVDSMSTNADWGIQQSLYPSVMNMGKRIALRLRELGWRQTDLLDRIPDLSPGTLSAMILRDSKRSEFTTQIAGALGVTGNWLQDGTNPKLVGGMFGDAFANTEPAPKIAGSVPLISWVQAGLFCTSPDLFHPGDAEDWIPTMKKYGPHTYALRVIGDSMVLPYPSKDSIFPGTIIFVDPDKPLTNGSKVIARIEGTDEATCKVFKEDMGRRFLNPQNPQYPAIEMDQTMQICGVVVGRYIEE